MGGEGGGVREAVNPFVGVPDVMADDILPPVCVMVMSLLDTLPQALP